MGPRLFLCSVGDVLHDVLEVAIKCLTYLAQHIGLDILSFGEFCHRSGGYPGQGDQILFIHVFVNQELPQFVVADHYLIPPLPFLPVQLVVAGGKFNHNVAVDDFLRFLVVVVYVVDGDEYLVSSIPVDLNDLFQGVFSDVFEKEGVVYQMGEFGQVQASDVKHYESFWDEKDSAKLREDIDKVFHSRGGREKYWDNVPLTVCKKDFKIEVRECKKKYVTEIDNFSELVIIDPSYKDYKSGN